VPIGGGRVIGIVESGNPDGPPVFYFHGFPGSRLESGFLEAAAITAGVRLIGVDRPGMGYSTPVVGRSVLDWPDDVERLGRAIGLDRFAVIGYSAGGPYAAACARQISHRLTGCAIVSGAGDMGVARSFAARYMARSLLPPLRCLLADEATAAQALARFLWIWPEPDRSIVSRPEIMASMARSLPEAFKQGIEGAVEDARLLASPLGFSPGEITGVPVAVWHGERDRVVPVTVGQIAAQAIPHAASHILAGEGHVSLIGNRGVEILRSVAGAQ